MKALVLLLCLIGSLSVWALMAYIGGGYVVLTLVLMAVVWMIAVSFVGPGIRSWRVRHHRRAGYVEVPNGHRRLGE